MCTPSRESGNVGKANCRVNGGAGDAPVRRYASFVVRGWGPGVTQTLEIAHDQTGERVRADSLVEAIGWIQARSLPATAPVQIESGNGPREQFTIMGPDQTAIAAA